MNKNNSSNKLAIGILVFFGLIFLVGGIYVRYFNKESVPTWDEHMGEIEELKEKIKILEPKLRAYGSNLTCENSYQCKVVGVGPKLCGYHRNYLVFSTFVHSEFDVNALVQEYNHAAERLNSVSYKVLSCGVAPGSVSCVDKVCALDK